MKHLSAASRTIRYEAAWVGRATQRAAVSPGQERDLVVQSLKGAVAAMAAWFLVAWFLPAGTAVMAPWVALVLVQATVYRSVLRGVQQSLSIALGVVLATAGFLVLERPALAMAVVLPLTMLLGNWPRLGDQGVYSATAALFTLSAGDTTLSASGGRVLATVIGAVSGIAVNALLFPPVYLRDARLAVQNTLEETREILDEVAAGLREPWDYSKANALYERARRLPRRVRGVQASVEWDRESVRLNPERGRRAARTRTRPYDDETLRTLEEVAAHLIGLTRTLRNAADEHDEDPKPEPEVTDAYADLLCVVSAALCAYSRTVTEEGGARQAAERELRTAVERVRKTRVTLRDRLPKHVRGNAEDIAVFGALLMDAQRLTNPLVGSPSASES